MDGHEKGCTKMKMLFNISLHNCECCVFKSYYLINTIDQNEDEYIVIIIMIETVQKYTFENMALID